MTYRRASTAISQTQLSVVAASPPIIASAAAAAAAAAITSRQQFTAHGPPTQYSFVRSFKRKYWREIGDLAYMTVIAADNLTHPAICSVGYDFKSYDFKS